VLSVNLPAPAYSCDLAMSFGFASRHSVVLAPVSAVPSPAEHLLQSSGFQTPKGSKNLKQKGLDFGLRG